MTEKNIHLRGVDDIKLLCDAAVKYAFDIDILSENYIIDAKSFMGIFSLRQKEDVKVRASVDAEQAKVFFEEIKLLWNA